jgi:hypothetical protein
LSKNAAVRVAGLVEKGQGRENLEAQRTQRTSAQGAEGKFLSAMGVKVTLRTQRKAVKVSCDA